MQFKSIQKALAIGVIAVSSSFAMQAYALPTFTFTESAGFDLDDVAIASYTGLVSGATAPVGDGSALYSSMNWYDTSTTKSTLTIENPAADSALPIGVWTTITTLTHANNSITSNPLHGWGFPQDLFGRLIISDGGGVVKDDENLVTLTLDETFNDTANPCPAPNPLGSVCDDKFTFTVLGLADLLFQASDNSLWTASFQLIALNDAFVDFVNGIVYTAEKKTSKIAVQVMLTQRDKPPGVPEPATLGILGLGLLGLGIAKRRKQNG